MQCYAIFEVFDDGTTQRLRLTIKAENNKLSSDIRISNRLSVAVRGNVSLSPFPYPSPHVLLVRSFVTNASLVRLLL